MRSPGIEEKVAFLSKPEAYPGQVDRVEIKQTHMSWIFLTNRHAWKLKKPVRTGFLDFSTPEARRRDCVREVRLNRRLALDVYHGVVPLTVSRQGTLELHGQGKPVDWLVCMRRLPSDRMLDEVMARHNVSEEELISVVSVLAAFYMKAPPVRITGSEYRRRLADDVRAIRSEFTKVDCGLPASLVESIFSEQLELIEQNPSLFDARIATGKIIEAHGDLRPEHICLERPPIIIDCLEFSPSLRILDMASELSFLALECERLGGPEIGELIFKKYSEVTGDRPGTRLLQFYRSYHACVRAQLALWHLKDDDVRDRAIWVAKARQYLEMVHHSYVAV